jgi:hypothetical protein
VLTDALRTDMRAFRELALAEPLVVELREWSRMTDDLNAERNRLCDRLREQLWRYFPATLECEPSRPTLTAAAAPAAPGGWVDAVANKPQTA